MATLPSDVNGVTVEFASTVDKNVVQSMVDALKHCIKSDIATGHVLQKIYVSSANDSHSAPSRHVQQKAVDISRINGTKIVLGYPGVDEVKAIVQGIQDCFEGYAQRRENFGPYIKKKSGQNWTVSGHDDHIHLSVE